jgi:hypothetical protein
VWVFAKLSHVGPRNIINFMGMNNIIKWTLLKLDTWQRSVSKVYKRRGFLYYLSLIFNLCLRYDETYWKTTKNVVVLIINTHGRWVAYSESRQFSSVVLCWMSLLFNHIRDFNMPFYPFSHTYLITCIYLLLTIQLSSSLSLRSVGKWTVPSCKETWALHKEYCI